MTNNPYSHPGSLGGNQISPLGDCYVIGSNLAVLGEIPYIDDTIFMRQ